MISYEIKVDLRDFTRFCDQFPRVVRAETKRSMETITIQVRKDVIAGIPLATGGTRKAVQREVVVGGGKDIDVLGRVWLGTRHATALEVGQRAHGVDSRRLLAWARAKIRREGVKFEQGKGRYRANIDRQVRSVAYLVARKIKKEGVQGKFMFKAAYENAKPLVRREMKAMAKRVAKRVKGRP